MKKIILIPSIYGGGKELLQEWLGKEYFVMISSEREFKIITINE